MSIRQRVVDPGSSVDRHAAYRACLQAMQRHDSSTRRVVDPARVLTRHAAYRAGDAALAAAAVDTTVQLTTAQLTISRCELSKCHLDIHIKSMPKRSISPLRLVP